MAPTPAIQASSAQAAASLPSDALTQHAARPQGCKKRATRVLQAKSAKVMELARSPRGVSIDDICGMFKCDKETARDMIASLRWRNYITGQVKQWGATRYFDTPERASEYKPEPKDKAAAVKPRTHWPLNLPGTPKPMHVPTGPGVVVPDGVKRTACPNWTHDPRFQCAPGDVPFGAGFAAVGIGRNVDTGRGWEVAA